MAVTLKDRVKQLNISSKKSKDFDPEDDNLTGRLDSSDSEQELEDASNAGGREHYEIVGKSRLRQPKSIELDSEKYGGQVISRATLNGDSEEEDIDPLAPEDDEEEDPFAARGSQGNTSDNEEDDQTNSSLGSDGLDSIVGDEDDEIDSDDAFEEGDEEKFRSKGFVFRGSGISARGMVGDTADSANEEPDSAEEQDDEQSDIDADELSEDSDIDMDDASDQVGDSDEDSDVEAASATHKSKSTAPSTGTDREKLKSLISSDTAAIATSLSKAASADAEKGRAVKRQYQTFDRFLDARIKLQKGVTTVNELSPISTISDVEAQNALKRAEEAALNLFSTIESIRHSILDAHAVGSETNATKKRKRTVAATATTSTAELQRRIEELEAHSLPYRRTILDKWSAKTRNAAPTLNNAGSSKLNGLSSSLTTNESRVSSVLDTYLLSTTDRLVSESSTIPSDATSKSSSDLPPFQDTIFYQSLLRDLIATRSHLNPSSIASASTTILPTKLHPSGTHSAALRNKEVDRKASKGRKVRYTVHEKLENFMAGTGTGRPEDSEGMGVDNARTANGQWTDAAVREFFGSLMGNRNALVEDSDDDEDGEAGEDGREMEALKLFRS